MLLKLHLSSADKTESLQMEQSLLTDNDEAMLKALGCMGGIRSKMYSKGMFGVVFGKSAKT